MRTFGRFDTWDLATGELVAEDSTGTSNLRSHMGLTRFWLDSEFNEYYTQKCHRSSWVWTSLSEKEFKSIMSALGIEN